MVSFREDYKYLKEMQKKAQDQCDLLDVEIDETMWGVPADEWFEKIEKMSDDEILQRAQACEDAVNLQEEVIRRLMDKTWGDFYITNEFCEEIIQNPKEGIEHLKENGDFDSEEDLRRNFNELVYGCKLLNQEMEKKEFDTCPIAMEYTYDYFHERGPRRHEIFDLETAQSLRGVENECLDFPLTERIPYYDKEGNLQFSFLIEVYKKGRGTAKRPGKVIILDKYGVVLDEISCVWAYSMMTPGEAGKLETQQVIKKEKAKEGYIPKMLQKYSLESLPTRVKESFPRQTLFDVLTENLKIFKKNNLDPRTFAAAGGPGNTFANQLLGLIYQINPKIVANQFFHMLEEAQYTERKVREISQYGEKSKQSPKHMWNFLKAYLDNYPMIAQSLTLEDWKRVIDITGAVEMLYPYYKDHLSLDSESVSKYKELFPENIINFYEQMDQKIKKIVEKDYTEEFYEFLERDEYIDSVIEEYTSDEFYSSTQAWKTYKESFGRYNDVFLNYLKSVFLSSHREDPIPGALPLEFSTTFDNISNRFILYAGPWGQRYTITRGDFVRFIKEDLMNQIAAPPEEWIENEIAKKVLTNLEKNIGNKTFRRKIKIYLTIPMESIQDIIEDIQINTLYEIKDHIWDFPTFKEISTYYFKSFKGLIPVAKEHEHKWRKEFPDYSLDLFYDSGFPLNKIREDYSWHIFNPSQFFTNHLPFRKGKEIRQKALRYSSWAEEKGYLTEADKKMFMEDIDDYVSIRETFRQTSFSETINMYLSRKNLSAEEKARKKASLMYLRRNPNQRIMDYKGKEIYLKPQLDSFMEFITSISKGTILEEEIKEKFFE